MTRAQLDMLTKLNRFTPGETIHLDDENIDLCYDGASWNELKNISISMYEVNKQIMAQLPNLTPDQLEKVKEEINSSLTGNYFMLLCKDISYYTIFKRDFSTREFSNLGEAVITCIEESLGNIVTTNIEDGAIEIWFRAKESDDVYCMYLFNCESMIVRYQN